MSFRPIARAASTSAAILVVEANPSFDLGLEDAVFGAEVFILNRQLSAEQPRHGRDQWQSGPVERFVEAAQGR